MYMYLYILIRDFILYSQKHNVYDNSLNSLPLTIRQSESRLHLNVKLKIEIKLLT